ncbi:MAG: hypothetical protein WD066_06095 [Planctomycetaceae bacterium]
MAQQTKCKRGAVRWWIGSATACLFLAYVAGYALLGRYDWLGTVFTMSRTSYIDAAGEIQTGGCHFRRFPVRGLTAMYVPLGWCEACLRGERVVLTVSEPHSDDCDYGAADSDVRTGLDPPQFVQDWHFPPVKSGWNAWRGISGYGYGGLGGIGSPGGLGGGLGGLGGLAGLGGGFGGTQGNSGGLGGLGGIGHSDTDETGIVVSAFANEPVPPSFHEQRAETVLESSAATQHEDEAK